MTTVRFPYGREHISVDIPSERLTGVLASELHDYKPELSQDELVREALEHPIGTPRLSEMAEGKRNVVIIASDHTRPVPSKVIMPQLLAEIRKGNPQADVTILISTGCHRGTTKEELIDKFGPEIVERERIVVHDCDDPTQVSLGKLPSGGELIIDRVAADADLLVAEGFIEPHFFAGFSGGRKSVLPGVASRKTVLYNHNSEFIASDHARTGIVEGNPIHTDMLYAARAAHLAFICNVVINAEREVVHAVAGDVDLAHIAGRDFLASKCKVDAVMSDIVISSNGGYPLDQNVYQAVKGMTAAEATVKEGGVIIMVAKSNDGHGGEEFYRTFKEEKDLNRIMDSFLATPKEETVPDQWESQIFTRVMMRATVIYVSDAPDEMISDFHMIPAHSLEEALRKAEEIVGDPNASVCAIPDGVSVIVSRG